jgi:hypothetical protein
MVVLLRVAKKSSFAGWLAKPMPTQVLVGLSQEICRNGNK